MSEPNPIGWEEVAMVGFVDNRPVIITSVKPHVLSDMFEEYEIRCFLTAYVKIRKEPMQLNPYRKKIEDLLFEHGPLPESIIVVRLKIPAGNVRALLISGNFRFNPKTSRWLLK